MSVETQSSDKAKFWWLDWILFVVGSVVFVKISEWIYFVVFLFWQDKSALPPFRWYIAILFIPLALLLISWIRPFMVKGDKFIVGSAKFPSFRRYAISVNDISKIYLWCWPPPEVDLSDTSQEFWFWQAIYRRYRGPIILYVWDKDGKKYQNVVTNIALFKGLMNRMKEKGLISSEWLSILPPLLVPSEVDRNATAPTLVTDIVEDMIGTVGSRDRKFEVGQDVSNTKECPFCHKLISETAIRCKHCRKVMPGKASGK
jgi:hypothetical protein